MDEVDERKRLLADLPTPRWQVIGHRRERQDNGIWTHVYETIGSYVEAETRGEARDKALASLPSGAPKYGSFEIFHQGTSWR